MFADLCLYKPQYNNEELQQMEEKRRQREGDLPRQADEANARL